VVVTACGQERLGSHLTLVGRAGAVTHPQDITAVEIDEEARAESRIEGEDKSGTSHFENVLSH
jgi:hypothetical protein